MINPQEFRLGNRVMHGTREDAIVQIFESAVSIDAKPDPIHKEHHRIAPLPITEYHLKCFGFKLNKPSESDAGFANIVLSYWVKDCVCLFYNESDVEMHKAGPITPMSWLGGYGFIAEGKYFAATFKWIQYVHQLQNLFFVLTGKELSSHD